MRQLSSEEIEALIEKCRHFENENLHLHKLLNIESITPMQDLRVQPDATESNESQLTTQVSEG